MRTVVASAEASLIRAQLFPSRAVRESPIDEWREQELRTRANDSLPSGVSIRPGRIASLPCEWLDGSSDLSKRVILYLHGGGYVLGGCATHRNLAARLALAADARVIVPEYRLAPEHPFPIAVEDAAAVYEALLESGIFPSRLAVAGDSAGGGLAAALLLSLRDSRRPLPALAVLISPWSDLSLSGDSYRTRADLDPIDRVLPLRRMAQCYLGKHSDPKAPLASPIFGDLSGLPPMLVQVGDHEVLLDDATRLAQKARGALVDVELKIWPEMWHGWHLAAPALPEANEAISQAGAYVRARMTCRSLR